MKVLIAKAPSRSGWTKFHRDGLCSGLRKGELADGADYVSRELGDLPDNVKPCQFECCFQGYSTAADLKSRVHGSPTPKPARGVRVGQLVTFREVGHSETKTIRLVDGGANRADGELPRDTPIAKGLLGHEAGEVVDIQLPSRVLLVEILKVK